MKRIIFAVTCLLLSVVSVSALDAQDRITLKMGNVPLVRILDRIEEVSNYSFLYNKQIVDVDKHASVDASNEALFDILPKLFADTDIHYTVEGRQIVLSRKETKVFDRIKQQIWTLSGTVVDNSTEAPLAGVTIIVEGTAYRSVTDVEGRFTLQVQDGAVISFSYFGYTPLKITFGGQPNMNVRMTEELNLLDDIVVVGYGTTTRKNLATAVSQVKTDDVPQSANSNLNQLLMGRAAGLQATTNTGQPDGKVNISIRGGGTPIYVVDGVIMPANAISMGDGNSIGVPSNVDRSGMAGINPGDVESIEVLKDASAAIYGIRAANGVILITTKKGSEGKPRVAYDGSYTWVRNYPYADMLDAQEYMNFSNIFSKENYLYNRGMYPYGGLEYDGGWSPLFSDSAIANANTTNWQDYVLKSGYITNHNVTISGGTKAFSYYVGGNFFNQDGTVVNSGMQKYTLRTNLSAQIFSFFRVTTVLNANQNSYNNAMVGTDNGNRGNLAAGALHAAMIYPSFMSEKNAEGSYTIYNDTPNPSAMRQIEDWTKENGYTVNLTADLNLWKEFLKVKGIYGLNNENAKRSTFIPSTVYFALMEKARGNLHSQRRRTQTMEAMLTFSKMFGEAVQFDALLGFGKYLEDYDGMGTSYEGVMDAIRQHNISTATGTIYPSSYTGENEQRSQFAKVGMDILDRYVINASLRRDGSDKFFPGQKYEWFPSVSFAWKISNEKFLKGVEWLNLLKLRGSWGIAGSDNLGSSLYGTYGASDFRVVFNDNGTSYTTYVLLGADSPWVSWQKTDMKNIGLDFYMLGNRISGSLDYFRNDVTRLLGTDASAPLAMFETRKVNYGHYYRRGWEIMLNSMNFNRQFKWETSLTVSRVNVIWKYRQDNYAYQTYQQRESEPYNSWYYYKTDGIINESRSNMPESQKTLQAAAQMPGMPIIVDKNGDGVIDIADIHLKNTLPDIYLGFGNSFSYKNFDLDIYLYGQFGVWKNNVLLTTTSAAGLISDYPNNTTKFAYWLWNSQTNNNGSRPGIALSNMGNLPGNAWVDSNMQNASFVKVRNMTFGYTFNQATLGSKIGKHVTSIRIYFDAQNPFTFTRYDGFDPEMYTGGGGAGGGSRGEFPAIRSFSLGAKLTF